MSASHKPGSRNLKMNKKEFHYHRSECISKHKQIIASSRKKTEQTDKLVQVRLQVEN